MPDSYYKPCDQLTRCNELIEKYYLTGQYEKCFEGHLELAEQGYPLAECQVGWFYFEGLGVKKDVEKAFFWTRRAAEHSDRDAQYNLADLFYAEGIGTDKNPEQSAHWYRQAALQNHPEAIEKCRELNIELN